MKARTTILFIALMLESASAIPARAELLGETIKPFASVTGTYDSNVFRVKDRNQLKAQIGDEQLSDFITTLTMGTNINYQISRQALNLMLKRDYLLYNHYSNQDAVRDNVTGNLALSVLGKLKVAIDGAYVVAPESRADYRSTEINNRRELNGGISAAYEMQLGLGFEAAYKSTTVEFSLPQYRTSEYSRDLYSGTLFYRFSAETKLYGSAQREYMYYKADMNPGNGAISNNNVSDSIRIGLNKTVSPKTTISGYIGYLQRSHNASSARDFEGLIGRADITYGITSKLGVVLNGERQLYEETYFNRIYSINDSVGLGLVYQVSNKMKVSISDKLLWKEFSDIPNSGVAPRNDFINEIKTGLEWSPLTRLTVNVGYQFSMRDSSDATLDFTDHTLSSGIAYHF